MGAKDVKVLKEGNRYVAEFDFDYHIKNTVKAMGFRFDWDTKRWWTYKADLARDLASWAEDHEALNALNNERILSSIEQLETHKKSSSITTSKDFPVPDGLKYLPYQRAGIEFASSKTDCLLADEMGLGKTVQAISTVNNIADAKNILIICPKSVKHNWFREWTKWDVKKLSASFNRKSFPDTDVAIINYDVVKKYRTAIDARDWDVLICDESHYMKGPKSSRTRHVLGHGKKIPPIQAKKRLLLSGTPVINRPIDLWTTINAFDPTHVNFGSWYDFIHKFCDAYQDQFGYRYNGASNLGELQSKLRSTFMIRRLKSEVLTELPDKRRQVVVLPLNGEGELVRHENKLQEDKKRIASELETALMAGDTAKVRSLREVQGLLIQEIAKARVLIGKAKVPYVIEHLRNALEEGQVVLFAHHHEVFDLIEEGLKDKRNPKNDIKFVKVVGSVSQPARIKAIDDFQNGKAQLFLGGLRAASEGINLTKSNHVIFAEQDWTDAIMRQAEDRCHRYGQEKNVLVQQLVMDESYDANMALKIDEKGFIMDETLNL